MPEVNGVDTLAGKPPPTQLCPLIACRRKATGLLRRFLKRAKGSSTWGCEQPVIPEQPSRENLLDNRENSHLH